MKIVDNTTSIMIPEELLHKISEDLEEGLPLNASLPNNGFLHIDKLLPYICVYRFKKQDFHFSGILRTQASYLIIDETINITSLLEQLTITVSKKLNTFLILEMWPVKKNHQAKFEIFCPKDKAPGTINSLVTGIRQLQDIYPEVTTRITDSHSRHPEHLDPLMKIDDSKESGGLLIGLAVPVLYENAQTSEIYSIFYRKFVSDFSEIIKRAVFEFIRVQTSNPFNHYLMLGKTNVDQVTLEADRALAKISEGMSFLLRTTPVNSNQEWVRFKENGFEKEPAFTYRLIALDPEQEKRKLYDIPIELIEDPTLSYILRNKRLEIEKQLTMLEERGTNNFRFVGESLYGAVENKVLRAARDILKKFPKGDNNGQIKRIDCHQFAESAQKEINYYQAKFPELKLSLEIRKDVAGIMVSETKLLISDQLSMDAHRCDALIQHEIGTHILTYCNGKNQPFKQMYAGFSGYDQMQEGLAVLAEYLVDGLTVNRLRLLAGRVVAVESMVKGAGFLTTFNLLRKDYSFPEKTAYFITMRVYRGGGLTKDAVYLAGLMDIIDYIKQNGDLNTLYTGKFNITHVALIQELLHRKVLRKAELPRFLERESVKKRLLKLSNGLKVTELLD